MELEESVVGSYAEIDVTRKVKADVFEVEDNENAVSVFNKCV